VVRAVVDAGATSISTVLLHLRGRVRQHYLDHLQEHRPDLVEGYERQYRGSYLPKERQRRHSLLISELVAEAGGGPQTFDGGGLTVRFRGQMGGDGPAGSPVTAPALPAQLGLGV
jgi:hypothetical protein